MSRRPTATWLFVPGTRSDRFDRAAASGAAEVILDLEDAVAPADKESARAAVADWLDARRGWVRINGFGTPWYDEDLAAVADRPGLVGIVLPKAESRTVMSSLETRLGRSRVVALIESAVGLDQARTLAQSPAVVRLAFGSLDYALDIGAEHTDSSLLSARSDLVLASRLAGLMAPIDGVTQDVRDPAATADDARRSRRLGFGGKLCIHPAQVDPVEEAFAPTADELHWAGRVAEVMRRAAGGVVLLDGQMIDKPVLERAERILGG